MGVKGLWPVRLKKALWSWALVSSPRGRRWRLPYCLGPDGCCIWIEEPSLPAQDVLRPSPQCLQSMVMKLRGAEGHRKPLPLPACLVEAFLVGSTEPCSMSEWLLSSSSALPQPCPQHSPHSGLAQTLLPAPPFQMSWKQSLQGRSVSCLALRSSKLGLG